MILKKKVELTLDTILSKISEYDIYRFYYGRDFPIGQSVKSSFPGRKEDKNPSLCIGVSQKTGKMCHMDYGDARYKGGVIDFVSQMTMLQNYNDILERLDNDFQLGIRNSTMSNHRAITSEWKQPSDLYKKEPSIITVTLKPFDFTELNYWKFYHLTKEDLKKENVYSIKKYWIDGKRIPLKNTDLVFGYLYDDKWKIYRPYADKKDKWRTNANNDVMDGIKDISSYDRVIITKAKKDKMVVKKVFPAVCSVQSENTHSISDENLALLEGKEVYVAFDCDEAGKKASKWYTSTYGWKHINVPDKYMKHIPPFKDFADMGRFLGLEAISEFFKEKQLL